MDKVECAINRLMRKLEGNIGDRYALQTICAALVEAQKTPTNKPSDEISICRCGDGVCKFKSVSYRCRNPEWCSYKLKLSHFG